MRKMRQKTYLKTAAEWRLGSPPNNDGTGKGNKQKKSLSAPNARGNEENVTKNIPENCGEWAAEFENNRQKRI
jgi:hypothetical protein